MKELSIIVPMYNSSTYIEKCLKSMIISKESIENLEVIIINDGSTDDSMKKVIPYINKYPQVFKVVEKENGGHGSAINTGILHCMGRYFKVVDADDWVETEVFESAVRKLKEIDADVVVSGYQTFDIKKAQICEKQVTSYQEKYYSMKDILQMWKGVREIFCIHGLMYKLDFYSKLQCRLPEQVYYDDAYYYTVPCSHAKKIYLLHDLITVYRIGDTEQSVSVKNRVRRISQHETVIKAILNEDIGKLSDEGKRYWLLKSRTTVCDYFTTAFLRYSDRKSGRKLAVSMYCYIKARYPELYRSLRKRYRFYKCLHLLHVDDEMFTVIVNSGIYRRLVNGK